MKGPQLMLVFSSMQVLAPLLVDLFPHLYLLVFL